MNNAIVQPALQHIPITKLRGVGTSVAERLHRLHIDTVVDVLFHLPLRYQDRTRTYLIAEVSVGDQVAISGEIVTAKMSFARRRQLICYVKDTTGLIQLRFFHFSSQQQQQLAASGQTIWCFGDIRAGRDHLEMVHPEYRLYPEGVTPRSETHFTAIYPTTKGLSNNFLLNLTGQALNVLEQYSHQVDLLPAEILSEPFKSWDMAKALRYVHRPPADAPLKLLQKGEHVSQQRLALEELIAHQLGLQRLRHQIKQKGALPLLDKSQCGAGHDLQQQFKQQLPFVLTGAQQRVMDEINRDLSGTQPMLRLVQGDVGSGKTVVAAWAMVAAVQQNTQAALMAPTELLAEQHYHALSEWLAPLNICLGLLLGQQKAAVRKKTLEGIAQGHYQIIVGTHALFQEAVNFHQLSVIVIDEQHRFGVHQRLALKRKNVQAVPHQLIMTATPIPRTLAMTAYADLDISIIDELPPGRKPIQTLLVSNDRQHEIVQRLRENCTQGRQAYWVCTLITDSEIMQCQAAEALAATLQDQLGDLRIGLIHGRLKKNEQEDMMQRFKHRQLDILVATTVVEVGVDVPNASIMIIENAERFGLAQLHQLRGRVGRGSVDSFCVLLYQAPLSVLAGQRLQVMRESQDGFYIAQKDLEMRGPGEVLGARQTGLIHLRIADLMRDAKLIAQAKRLGWQITQQYPEKVNLLIGRWIKDSDEYIGI